MAERTETTKQAILNLVVNNNEAMQQLAAYDAELQKVKTSLQAYQDKVKQGEELSKEEANEYRALQETQKALKKAYNDTSYQVQKNIQQNKENEGSLKSLRGELSQLNSQYDALSRDDRLGEAGQRLQSRIASVTNELKRAEEQTGRFQRNVGNYTNQMVTGFKATAGAAGGMVTPIKNVTTGVKALKTAGGWIGLLANILVTIISKLKGNEAAMNAVRTALAPLTSLGVMFNKVLEKMTNWIASVVTNLGKYAKQLGLVNTAMTENQKLAEKENKLLSVKRKNLVITAEREREIAELRAKIAQKDKYTASERLEMLKKASDLEKAILNDNRIIAKSEYEIALARSKQGANSKEDMDRLAELEAEKIRTETAYYNKQRELNAQIASTMKETAKSNGGEVATSWLDGFKESFDKALAESEKIFEERLQKMQEEGDFSDIQWLFDMDDEAVQAGMEELEQSLAAQDAMEQYYADKEIERQEKLVAARKAAATAIGDALAALGDLSAELGEQDEQLAKASKVLALAQIAINTGVATAEGISSAMAVGFPANIAAIATTIAAIASGMTSAIASVKSAKFARGGYVSGEGTGTSDSISARLSNGEAVINANSTSMFAPLLSALNQMGGGNAIEPPTGGNTAVLEQAIARGMQAANLEVSVTEIDTVRDRMTRINSVANA